MLSNQGGRVVRIMAAAAFAAGGIWSFAGLKTELVIGGLHKPIFVCSPPGDSNRLFIVEQHTARIRIFDLAARALKPVPFMVAPNIDLENEQGLLGLAFHPSYASNGYFYVNITAADAGGRTEILRYTAAGDPATSESADLSTKKLILSFPQPEANHNGGWTAFGPDGYLYISSGDGGGGNDQHGPIGNAQNRENLLGKILRIDVDGGNPYAIPNGNPYKDHPTFRPEIWAFGLRNPWRCSFDPVTGHLWIADVGQSSREEIDVIPAGVGGLNFGWRPREGTIRNPSSRIPSAEEPVTEAVEPVFDYSRTFGVSVTGGHVYRGNSAPEIFGKYIFADYASARFWALTPDATGTNGTAAPITGLSGVGGISSFGVDARGELYVCDHVDGEVFRILTDAPSIRLESALAGDGQFVLSFEAAAGREHVVETRAPLESGSQWLQSQVVAGAATNRLVSVTNSVTGTERYFKVRLP